MRTLTAVLVAAVAAPVLAQFDKSHKAVEAKNGMVVAVSPPAVDVGVEILKKGGNAVDAAVAVAFAMAVTWPEAGNIGGGGFMMVHPGRDAPKDAAPVCIEYRETAPAAATRDMFAKGEHKYGHKVVGVPGTVRGLALAHFKFGRLPWRELVAPAAKLAREGFELDAATAKSLNGVLKTSATQPEFAELRRVFGRPGGGEWQAGDVLVQPDLAWTMQMIAAHGPDEFYLGSIADKIVYEMYTGRGLMTKGDLAAYRSRLRETVRTRFRGCDVYGAPPPSSGGICLTAMLQMLESENLAKLERWSSEAVHLRIEAMRRMYFVRALFLGDSDFAGGGFMAWDLFTPQALLRSVERRGFDDGLKFVPRNRATPSVDLTKHINIPIAEDSPNTTHFSVIDRDGMAVANTYTLEHSFGSRIVVKGAGFLLNNEMLDFNPIPGRTDRTGRIGTEPNTVAPGKRPLSSQTPTIVAKDGKVVLVTGSPGGRTIINTVLCVVLNVLEFEMDIQAAVDEPRLHHQWLPDKVRFEPAVKEKYPELIKKLEAMGHVVEIGGRQGDAHSIWVDPKTGTYHGAADRRIAGKAAGW
jgi:gamma-glutamyltranspeptidase/glutathione hydrolase